MSRETVRGNTVNDWLMLPAGSEAWPVAGASRGRFRRDNPYSAEGPRSEANSRRAGTLEAREGSLGGVTMRKLLLAALIGLSITACQTPQQSAGTATGVVAGAVVGGPVGAVVGGVAGAAATAPGGPLSPGYCYVQNRRGQLIYDRAGRPLVRRCA